MTKEEEEKEKEVKEEEKEEKENEMNEEMNCHVLKPSTRNEGAGVK